MFGLSFRRLFALAGLIILGLSVRVLFIGRQSFEAILPAELYIAFFAVVAFGATVHRTHQLTGGDYAVILFVAALVGAVGAAVLAPTIGEPNYCGYFAGYYHAGLARTPPRTYRCTALPFGVAGWFGGWWFTLGALSWLGGRRSDR